MSFDRQCKKNFEVLEEVRATKRWIKRGPLAKSSKTLTGEELLKLIKLGSWLWSWKRMPITNKLSIQPANGGGFWFEPYEEEEE